MPNGKDEVAPDGFVEAGLAVAHPWLSDIMGHMATRHYAALFEDASYHLFAGFAPSPAEDHAAGMGWADVRHETEYRAEVASGTLLRLTGRVAAIGRTSLLCEFRLTGRSDGVLRTTLAARTVRFDLNARRASPIDASLRLAIKTAFPLAVTA